MTCRLEASFTLTPEAGSSKIGASRGHYTGREWKQYRYPPVLPAYGSGTDLDRV